MIVNLPSFNDAAARAGSRPSLSLGLHFNLTTGRPLTAAPSLTRHKTGLFYPLPVLVARASLGRIDSSDVVRECAAQLDRMTEVGIAPTHLDSHRHVHAHPALWPAVIEAASSRGISNVRVPTEPLWANAKDWRATLKKAGLLVCSRASRGSAASSGTDHFYGISLQGGRSFAARLFALIPRLPEGTTELMTHPGYADEVLSEYDGYMWQREDELRVLCSKELRELLLRQDIELTSFPSRAPHYTSAGKVAQHR
jgi:predicted glycoside hydrolase/deacetylase ChbG (UPF0249 family)